MRWLIVTLMMVGVGLAGCAKEQLQPEQEVFATSPPTIEARSESFDVFAPGSCDFYLITHWADCDGPWPRTLVEKHERIKSMRGILTEASFQPYTGPGRIINWTIASPDAERGSPRVLASVEGELPLELKAPEFPADIGQTVQHVIMLKDAAYDLEARYLDAEVTMEVEVHGDLRVERVREIRSIDYSGETGLCAFFVDPECYSLPGQDAGEPPVQGIAKNLTATLTWDAQWPTTEELTLAVTSRIDGSPSGPDAFRRWNGTSPLQVEVPGEFFRGPEGTLAFTVYGYRESLHPNVAGLGEFTALPQDFTLTASFEDWVYPSNGTRGDRWID